MNDESVALRRLLDAVFAYRPGVFGKITLPAYWKFSSPGAGTGPMSFYDHNMKPIPYGEVRDFSKGTECLDLFAKFLASDPSLIESRKVLEDGFLANRLKMTIFPDRRVEMAWSFDPEMDLLALEKAKKYMTQEEIDEAESELAEYMEHKGRSRYMRNAPREIKEEAPAPALPPSPAPEPKRLSIPDLFKEILVTALNAAPEGWSKVVIDGQVWVETDASGRALNNVSADFQAQMADGSVRQINPPQPIGAMNAFTRLQKELPNLEGKPWRHLRIAFDNGGPEQIAYWFDQGGIWRPES